MSLASLRGSLRLRLLAGTLVWIAASILVAGWGLASLFRQHVEQQFHAELQTHLDQLTAHLSLDAKGSPRLTLALSEPRFSRPYSGYYWQIDQQDGNGPGLLRSRSLWDHVLAVPADTPGNDEIHRHRISGPKDTTLLMVERSVHLDDRDHPRRLRLIAAADEKFMAEPVQRFSNMLWLALGLLAAGLCLAAAIQVYVGLAPLRALRKALSRVHEGETQRLEGSFPGELSPLIEEFNSVLAKNAEVVERARTHAGNLAHALKTPLSVLANAATDKHADPADLAPLVLDQVGIARTQVDYHLSRAQVAASRLPGAWTAVPPVVAGLVRAMSRIHAERQLEISVAPMPETLKFRGETQDLQEMLGNLLDNACKWATHTVTISAHADAETLLVTLDDDGPGLPAEQRAAVIQRGVRADQQVPGTGLGLAIVDDLSRLYGGRLELADSPLGGLRAQLTLPAAR